MEKETPEVNEKEQRVKGLRPRARTTAGVDLITVGPVDVCVMLYILTMS